MDTLLNWALRGLLLLLGAGAAVWIARWLREAWRERRERWPVRLALGMLLAAAVFAAGHARLLLQAEEIDEARLAYARFGDPRLAEQRRAEVRGWMLDCSARERFALARYGQRGDTIVRVYPLGEAGANLIGGGPGADERDYTIERLFAERLRRPRSFTELDELHPVGTDLRLTLCAQPTARAWRLLREAGRPGAVVVQDVQTGALVAYAATGTPQQAPLGIRRYAAPGSVFKLALAALWWESGQPAETRLACPARIQVTPRSSIQNFEGTARGVLTAPHEMLVYSCNTAAVQMALELRERIGSEAFVDAYQRFGFAPYAGEPPDGVEPEFWNTGSEAWQRRMSPPPARIRIGERTSRQEWAQLAIGQGPVDVTPIQVSRFVQAIGNRGVMLPPALEWERALEPREGRRIMSDATAQRLQAAMKGVVQRGTATRARALLEGSPWSLGGKTGTAQVARADDDGWFAGLMFDEQGRPRYSVVVYLQGGGPGGRAPAALAAQMTRLLAAQAAGEPREREREEREAEE